MYVLTNERLGEPSGSTCAPAKKRLDLIKLYLDIGNQNWAKKDYNGAPIQKLKDQVDGMIRDMDSYIKSECCEPQLIALKQEVRNLPWRSMNNQVALLGRNLVKEIEKAQQRSRTMCAELQAEREAYNEQKERFETTRREQERRLAPPPLDILPLEVFKRAGVTATTRVGKTTASLIQTVLERSRALRPYIGQKLGRIMIPKNFIHHDFDSTFNNSYTGLHKIVIPAGSAEEKELITRRGFYHPPTDAIHLRPAANVGHALHEAIHKFSSPGFRSVFGGYLDEGVTQYFTDVVLVEQGLGKMTTHTYQDQLRCANQLIGLFNPDIIAKAYFQGAGLQDLANILVGRLNTNLRELATKLKNGDALCKKIGTLTAPRPPASGASRGQPLVHARGAVLRAVVPRGAFFGHAPAFFGQASAFFGQALTPAKAAPMISKVGADRINL